VEAALAGDVRHRLARQAATDQLAQRAPLGVVDQRVVAEEDLHARATERLRHQVLPVGAGLREAGALEPLDGPLQHLLDGPELLARGAGRGCGRHRRGRGV
jgi:hypothetical protein